MSQDLCPGWVPALAIHMGSGVNLGANIPWWPGGLGESGFLYGLFGEATKEKQVWGSKIMVWSLWNLMLLHHIYEQMYHQDWSLGEGSGRGLGGRWGRKKEWKPSGECYRDSCLSPPKVSHWSQIHHLKGWIMSPPMPPLPARKEWDTHSA